MVELIEVVVVWRCRGSGGRLTNSTTRLRFRREDGDPPIQAKLNH